MDEATSTHASHAFGLNHITQMLQMLEASVPVVRRIVREGDVIFQSGQEFTSLYVVSTGFYKVLNMAGDGREQVVGLYFKGDWMGVDGIADGYYRGEAVAMDTGEVWAIGYDALLQSSLSTRGLLMNMHLAMSRELVRNRDVLLSLCTLPADARVAGFLRYWADALEQRGLRADQVTLRMSRAEIGNYLGMTLESVSRALSRMARGEVIRFVDKGRRDIHIPEVEALTHFMHGACAAPMARA